MDKKTLKVISSREAFDAGMTRYYTGKPCSKGHQVERMIRNGACVECLRLQRNRYARKHPEKVAEKSKRFRSSEKGLAYDRESKRRLRAGDPEKEKDRMQRWKERREQKLENEAGRPRQDFCDICGEKCRAVFDHCHASGKFRGWLCDRCNRTLGQVKDNPALLRSLATYLEKSNGQVDN